MIADWATYKDVTGDVYTAQGKAEAMLARAQNRIQDITGRLFDQATRTETLPVIDGAVYPSAYPIQSVSSPSGATLTGDGLCVQVTGADGAEVGWDCLADALGLSSTRVMTRTYATVTYVGGYAAGDAPSGLVDVVCELAQRYCQPANTAAVPAGATSVSVGGQSYSGRALGGAASIPPALKLEISRFKHFRGRMAD